MESGEQASAAEREDRARRIAAARDGVQALLTEAAVVNDPIKALGDNKQITPAKARVANERNEKN